MVSDSGRLFDSRGPILGALLYGYVSKLNHQGTAGFSLRVHLPGQPILGCPIFDPQPYGVLVVGPSNQISHSGAASLTISHSGEATYPRPPRFGERDPSVLHSKWIWGALGFLPGVSGPFWVVLGSNMVQHGPTLKKTLPCGGRGGLGFPPYGRFSSCHLPRRRPRKARRADVGLLALWVGASGGVSLPGGFNQTRFGVVLFQGTLWWGWF